MEKDFILDNKLDVYEYKKALDLIEKSRYILIVTHINPDADTISSALALSNFFSENRIKHKVFNISSDLPQNLDFIKGFKKIISALPKFYDLVISVDCGARSRLGFEISNKISLINIDHHKSNDRFGDINIVDFNKSSTAEIVFDFFRFNGLYITKETAVALYTGIYDDSLRFSIGRCDENTFEKANFLVKYGANPSQIANKLIRRNSLAKYRVIPKILDSLELFEEGSIAFIEAKPKWLKQSGAHLRDCEDALDMIMSISIVKIGVFLRISNNETRLSIRSKGSIDVSKIALVFGGGGHMNAAGSSINTTNLEEAKKMVLKEILEKKW